MKLILRRLGRLCLAAVLGFCGCQSERTETAASLSSDDVTRFRADHERLTEHLAAGVTWADILESELQAGAPVSKLKQVAARLERETGQAADLASALQTEPLPGDAEVLDRSRRSVTTQLEAARADVEEVKAHLADFNADALGDAISALIASLEAAADQHDAMVPAISDPGLRFRMFALSWPHHDLVWQHATLLKTLDAMESQAALDWPAYWKTEILAAEDEIRQSQAAVRGFADRLDVRLHSYSRVRLDDEFNELTDEIRRLHEMASQQARSLEVELRRPTPDRSAAEALLGDMRTEIQNARDSHRQVAARLGQPYPEYDPELL